VIQAKAPTPIGKLNPDHVFKFAADLALSCQWQHVNLLGEHDFSEERLQDTVEILSKVVYWEQAHPR
jgi:hypothetical protein